MKKTRLNPVGKIGKANREARKRIAIISQESNLNHCEIQLPGCMKYFGLAPAHRHKRDWYGGDVDKLSDPNEWVASCQWCHDQIEKSREKTEEVFNKLRPQ